MLELEEKVRRLRTRRLVAGGFEADSAPQMPFEYYDEEVNPDFGNLGPLNTGEWFANDGTHAVFWKDNERVYMVGNLVNGMGWLDFGKTIVICPSRAECLVAGYDPDIPADRPSSDSPGLQGGPLPVSHRPTRDTYVPLYPVGQTSGQRNIVWSLLKTDGSWKVLTNGSITPWPSTAVEYQLTINHVTYRTFS